MKLNLRKHEKTIMEDYINPRINNEYLKVIEVFNRVPTSRFIYPSHIYRFPSRVRFRTSTLTYILQVLRYVSRRQTGLVY